MKFRSIYLVYVAAALLLAVQIVYSVSGTRAPAPAETAPAAAPPPPAPPPTPADVTTLILSGQDGSQPVWLSRAGAEWKLETLHGAPAAAAKVERFLAALLTDEKRPAPPPAEGAPAPATAPATGTGPGEGVLVSIGINGGEAAPALILGLRPEGVYDAVYARRVDQDEVFLLPGDMRGDMGIWKNAPGALPENAAWLETRVFAFDPALAENLAVVYPDHRFDFSLGEAGEWAMSGAAPGGDWSADGLKAWLRDLSDFRIAEAADPDQRALYGLDHPSHTLAIRLKGGGAKTIAASPNRFGEGMWVETSDYPGQVFLLPGWRFQSYFQRLAALFPHASPTYPVDEISFIDIRRGGESVKLSRRDNEWRAVATRYPLRSDRILRLAKVLAGWRPADYADQGTRPGRPAFGGPLVEVTLRDGQVHQYRLGGRHPVFPWRYVLVDGVVMFSTDDADAASMFPEFFEIMDLGTVFAGLVPEQVTSLELTTADRGDAVLSAGRTASGEWEVVTSAGQTRLDPAEAASLVLTPLEWKVSAFYKLEAPVSASGLLKLRLAGGGAERHIVLLPPRGRDVPYQDDEGGTFLVDRNAFFTWLGALRGIDQRIESEAAARTAVEAGEAIKALETAESEALEQALEEEERAKAAAALEPPSEGLREEEPEGENGINNEQ